MGDPARALAAFPQLVHPAAERISQGLIHESFAVRDGAVEYVLQRVNPMFSPAIHENIQAVTEQLHAKGIATPRLLPAADGAPCANLGEAGIWRLFTRMPGVGFETCQSRAQARSAGALVARFHGALADLDHVFRPLGIVLHDTPLHLAELERAVARHRSHPRHAAVADIASEILAAAREWGPLAGLPERVTHGDLKFNNVLFDTSQPRALCLIDLDTVARRPLWVELGDAWRSWCNRAGEDSAAAELDLAWLEASAHGYLAALPFELGPAERASLVEGLERIALELAARFATDVLEERYFDWDPNRFPSRSEHNLVRARGQLSLFRQARETRTERLRILAGEANP